MQHIRKALFAVLLLTLAGGPLFAAPLSLSAGPTVTSTTHAGGLLAGAVKLLGVGALVFGTAIHVKDTGKIAQKFVTRAGQAAGDYKDGVANAGAQWEGAAKSSEPSYNAGVQAGISRGAFGKGVVGKASKYQTNAVNNGSVRYAPGVANAQDAYTRGIQPYLDRLKSLDLPPKGPRRSPQNQQRSVVVNQALGALREGK